MNDKDKTYHYEVSVLDSFFEFHPGWFESLTPAERESLRLYYGLGLDYYSKDADLPDIIEWRDKSVAADPILESRARAILVRVLRDNGQIDFTRSGVSSNLS